MELAKYVPSVIPVKSIDECKYSNGKTIDQKFIYKTLSKFFVKIVQFELRELPLMGIRINCFSRITVFISNEKYLKSVTGCIKAFIEIKRKETSSMSISKSHSAARICHE